MRLFARHLHNCTDPWTEAPAWAVELRQMLALIIDDQEIEMHSLDETLAVVGAQSTKIDSLVALTDGLEKQVADALAGETLSPAAQAKLDAVFDGVTSNSAKVQGELDKSVPPAVLATPAPVVTDPTIVP